MGVVWGRHTIIMLKLVGAVELISHLHHVHWKKEVLHTLRWHFYDRYLGSTLADCVHRPQLVS